MRCREQLKSLIESPLGEVFTGAAYRAKKSDVTAPLAARFAGESLLLLMVAKDRAATLRVCFDKVGGFTVGESRQIAREHGALAGVLQAEAREARSSWVLVVLSLGWQVEIGLRSSRSAEPGEAFDRHRLVLDHPELFVTQPREDLVYTVVDHPALDRSLVFGCKRRDLDPILEDLRAAGLGLAGLRLGVAAMIEQWLHGAGAQALGRDLLVSDGMSVLLLNVHEGDFGARPGAMDRDSGSLPRQASSRPTDVAQDLARFVRDNKGRPLTFLGPVDLGRALSQAAETQVLDLLRPEDLRLTDSVHASLTLEHGHDLNPEHRAARPPLARRWRPWLGLGFALWILLCAGTIAFVAQANGLEQRKTASAHRLQEARLRGERAESTLRELEQERLQALEIRDWVSSGYHAQSFVHRILSALPGSVSLERMAAQLDEGSSQLSLEFTLLGSDEAQVQAARAVERVVLGFGCQVGERSMPSSQGVGVSYRWRLILPAEKGGSRHASL